MHQRPVIAPGLPLLARGDGALQVGLSPRFRLRVTDTALARRTLAALARGERIPDRAAQCLLHELGPVLRDGGALVQPGLPDAEVAALVLRHPHSARARVAARREAEVEVVGELGVDPRPLLEASGLGPAAGVRRRVTLVLSQGEPDRGTIDALLRGHRPHLLVRAVEGELVVGPFVEPGRTACLRCVDAHLAEEDPLHPLLVSRAARLAARNDVAEPVDRASATVAIGLAVRDLVRYVEGDPVSTWSASIRLGPDVFELAPTPWSPHPACGCGWGASADGPEAA